MNKKPLSDFAWIRNGGNGCRYVCPLLMTLSLWVWRLQGKSAHWYQSSDFRGVYFDYGKSRWETPCVFPKRLAIAECSFWNSRAGVWLRVRGINENRSMGK